MKTFKERFSGIAPIIALFFTNAGRAVYKIAKEVVPEFLASVGAHPDWTDEQRRNEAVRIVSERLGNRYPKSAWLINFAIEYVVGTLRAQFAGR